MITIYKSESDKITSDGGLILAELRGLSTDDKPTRLNGTDKVANGSTFVEIDTGKKYMYDAENEEWCESSSGGSGSSSNTYSTTETQIGTYLGKPLYRKVIQITAEEYNALDISSGRHKLPIETLSVDRLLRADLNTNYNDGTKVSKKSYPSHSVGSNSGSYDIGINGIEDDNLAIVVGSSILNGLVGTIDIILEYTKTTD